MWRILAIALATGSLVMAVAQTGTDYGQMLRELRPKMTFEVTEINLNAYLKSHPQDFAIPEGFEGPHIGFGNGFVEVSALTKLLWVPTRVRVTMAPEVQRGRLRLRVKEIHAGPIPLPSSFHRGTADTIADIVNGMLDRNDMQLLSMQVERGLIRATAVPGVQTDVQDPQAQP